DQAARREPAAEGADGVGRLALRHADVRDARERPGPARPGRARRRPGEHGLLRADFDRVAASRYTEVNAMADTPDPQRPLLRHDFTLKEVRALHDTPLFELIDLARAVHRQFHAENEVQLCTLLSVKTGGCPEDCGYCSQSSHHETHVKGEAMLSVD